MEKQIGKEKMGEKNLAASEFDLAESARAEIRKQFPNMSEKRVETLVGVRMNTLLAEPCKIQAVDMGEDFDLSLNYKKHL